MIDRLPEMKEKPAAGEMRSDEFSDLKLGLYRQWCFGPRGVGRSEISGASMLRFSPYNCHY